MQHGPKKTDSQRTSERQPIETLSMSDFFDLGEDAAPEAPAPPVSSAGPSLQTELLKLCDQVADQRAEREVHERDTLPAPAPPPEVMALAASEPREERFDTIPAPPPADDETAPAPQSERLSAVPSAGTAGEPPSTLPSPRVPLFDVA